MKAPDLIILSLDPDRKIADVSFGDTRQRKLKYDIENITHMLPPSNDIYFRLRRVPKENPETTVKVTAVTIKTLNYCLKNGYCKHCPLKGTKLSEYPRDSDTVEVLCLKDWLDAGNKKPTPGHLWFRKVNGIWGDFKATEKTSKATPKTKEKPETAGKTTLTRDAAKALIRGEVENGADIQTLKSRQPGCSCDEYEAQVGGCANQKKYSSDKIIVTELRGRKLKPAAIFSLREIYNEIKKSSGAPDDDEKNVKEPLTVGYKIKNFKQIRRASNVRKRDGCKGCNFGTHSHPQLYVDPRTTTSLCLKDWVKAGNPIPNENNFINVSIIGTITRIT